MGVYVYVTFEPIQNNIRTIVFFYLSSSVFFNMWDVVKQ